MRLVAALCLAAMVGCPLEDERKQYDEVHLYAKQAVPWAVELEKQFPDTDHFITHYGFRSGTTPWNTVSFFGGRYRLKGVVDIKVNYGRRSFQVSGDPTFYLIEVVTIDADRSSRIGATYEFGIKEFNKLVEHGWDFSAIGIHINPTAVPRWDQYVAAWRNPRRPISLTAPRVKEHTTKE